MKHTFLKKMLYRTSYEQIAGPQSRFYITVLVTARLRVPVQNVKMSLMHEVPSVFLRPLLVRNLLVLLLGSSFLSSHLFIGPMKTKFCFSVGLLVSSPLHFSQVGDVCGAKEAGV